VGRGRRVHARGRAAVTLPAPHPHRGVPEPAGAPMRTSGTRADADPQHRSHDAPGLAHLARTGFFKPVHMKSLSAHALRSLIIARKKTGGPASDLGESDPRFGGRVREHNPSIPVARCAQIAVTPRRRGRRQIDQGCCENSRKLFRGARISSSTATQSGENQDYSRSAQHYRLSS
jgi:hypothetical protein